MKYAGIPLYRLSSLYGWSGGVVGRQRLQELVNEIDPKQLLDEDVEEVREVGYHI